MNLSQTALFILFSLSLVEVSASAGGMTSSGGELVIDEGNPWFIGDEPVTYCFVDGSGAGNFSVPLATSRAWTEEVLRDWSEALVSLRPAAVQIPSGDTKNLSQQFQEVSGESSCELKFVFGSPESEPVVASALSQHWVAREVIAFAKRISFDDRTGRGRGIVYMTPDAGSDEFLEKFGYHGPKHRPDFWSSKNVFKLILAHELGHVYGLTHEINWLMHPGMPWKVVAKGAQRYFAPAGLAVMNKFFRKDWSCMKAWDATAFELLLPGETVDSVCFKMDKSLEVKVNLGGGKELALETNFKDGSYSVSGIRGNYLATRDLSRRSPANVSHYFVSIPVRLNYIGTVKLGQRTVPFLVNFDHPTNWKIDFFALNEFRSIELYFPEIEE